MFRLRLALNDSTLTAIVAAAGVSTVVGTGGGASVTMFKLTSTS
jgi:hypothetical protein